MSAFFITVYRFFCNHKGLLYSLIVLLFAVFGILASKVSYEEDITRFVPTSADTKNISAVFGHLKVKDRIMVMFSPADSSVQSDVLVQTADRFSAEIDSCVGSTHINKITADVGSDQAASFPAFIYSNLPLFLDSDDYVRLDSMFDDKRLTEQMENNANQLMLPTGMFMKDFILQDPLGMGYKPLSRLQELKVDGDYQMVDGHLTTANGSVLLFLAPRFPASNTAENGVLVDTIESLINQYAAHTPTCKIDFYGGPVISVYNARQIRTDMMWTMGFALLVIAIVIFFSFKNKLSFVYITIPVAFGGLFALSVLYFLRGSLSIIAVGAGSAILGVLLSYSIHVVAHHEHCESKEQLIKEMWQPLTIGSFTTIGAFFSLVFTKSEVLQDFGWFASLSIVGATIFCLIFLPHLLSFGVSSKKKEETCRLLSWVERFTSIDYSKKKWLVAIILLASVGGVWLCDRVSFSSDMNSLGYQPEKFDHAQQMLDSTFQRHGKSVYFIAVADSAEQAVVEYGEMVSVLDSLKSNGAIRQYSSAKSLLVDKKTQQRRLDKWSSYWSPERKKSVMDRVVKYGEPFGFTRETFADFETLLDKDYHCKDWTKEPLLADFLTSEEGLSMVIAQVSLTEAQKKNAYEAFSNDKGVVILDKPHFMSQFVDAITDDFNFVLLVSSLIVFFALLLSYGRLELALLAFMPMVLSWFIILGVMALCGLQFNIVSVIISTFIFGTGDDFSIFITDGLLSEYKDGRPMLKEHKTAIFFSAFTTVVGMGALFMAKHPSLLGVAQTSVIGMAAVVLIAFTIQPLLWRFFVTSRTSKGKAPWTIMRFVTFLPLCLFLLMSLMLVIIIPLFFLLPSKTRTRWFHAVVTGGARLALGLWPYKKTKNNLANFNFNQPAIIISNHQSVMDLVVMFAHSTKFVPLVKPGVWNNLILGPINRMYRSICVSDGYENMIEPARKCMEDGYSILVFPEGTRCGEDQVLGKFHDGAFYMAEKLNADILPMVMMGNGNLIAKGDMFFLRPTELSMTMLPLVKHDDVKWGDGYRARRKSVYQWYKAEYERVRDGFVRTDNPFFANSLFQNYIYKGPVLEWYMRVKVRMENNYRVFNDLVPKNAKVTDIGCGYGFLDYMLMFMSKDRIVKGVDYDDEKIAVANHCFSRNERIGFESCNALEADLPLSDVFLLNDMLHYLPYESQQKLIERCMQHLQPGGCVIIRDGNSSNEEGQKVTNMTEVLSTKIFRFNKTEGQLFFTSRERIQAIAEANGFEITSSIKNDNSTSNEIYVLKQK